jgi:CBS domain containing-hemolysin-like protein
MSNQFGYETGKSKTSPGWLQRLASSLGFAAEASLRETLEGAIAEAEGEHDASLSVQERTMLLNLLRLDETKVGDVMIPRVDIVAIDEQDPVAALFSLFATTGHSRIPVYRSSLDNAVGMIHIKDAMAWAMRKAPVAAEGKIPANTGVEPAGFDAASLGETIARAKLVRDVLFVPPSMPALTLLAKMRATQIHLALVVDEFGGIDGLVAFEDIVEEIVGDVADEHDPRDALRIGVQDEAFIASARTPIEDVEQVLGISLANGTEVDTLGGLILTTVGSVPKRGQIIEHPSGVTFEILEATPRRLHTIRILKPKALAAPETPLLLPPPESGAGFGSESARAA